MRTAALYTASAIFAVVSVAHWLRYFLQISVDMGGVSIPQWLSLVAAIVSAGLAGWMLVAIRRP